MRSTWVVALVSFIENRTSSASPHLISSYCLNTSEGASPNSKSSATLLTVCYTMPIILLLLNPVIFTMSPFIDPKLVTILVNKLLCRFCWVNHIRNKNPQLMPKVSKASLKVSQPLSCCVLALLLCAPKSSQMRRGTLMCSPFYVETLSGIPF